MRLLTWVRFALLACCVAAAGCGPQDATVGNEVALSPTLVPIFLPQPQLPGLSAIDPTAFTVTGFVNFERVVLPLTAPNTFGGAILVTSAARFISVEARDAKGNAVSPRVATDANGAFTIKIKPDTDFFVVFLASTLASNGRVNAEVRAPVSLTPGASLPLYGEEFGAPDGNAIKGNVAGAVKRFSPIALSVFPTDIRASGPFAILDSALQASDTVRAVNNNVALPTMTYLWSPDPALDPGFSAFSPDGTAVGVPGPVTFIKGGDSDIDDTDEFDPDVIHHEYGHFTIHSLSRDSSLGGAHAADDVVYPTLAYSEGVANWFATIVSTVPTLTDSVAITGPFAQGFEVLNLETKLSPTLPRGRTSESSVGEILWDITDGVENRTDSDSDGVALTFGTVVTALRSLAGSIAYIVIDDVLQALVSQGALTAAQVQALLNAPDNQNILFAGGDVFPQALTLGTTANDTCTTIAAVGGADTGVDSANRFFKFDLPAQATVNVSLTLLGGATGLDSDGTHLGVVLLDSNNVSQTQSTVQAPFQLLRATLPSGRYYLSVSGRPDLTSGVASNVTSQTVPYTIIVQ